MVSGGRDHGQGRADQNQVGSTPQNAHRAIAYASPMYRLVCTWADGRNQKVTLDQWRAWREGGQPARSHPALMPSGSPSPQGADAGWEASQHAMYPAGIQNEARTRFERDSNAMRTRAARGQRGMGRVRWRESAPVHNTL
jgi:hypothetical protein